MIAWHTIANDVRKQTKALKSNRIVAHSFYEIFQYLMHTLQNSTYIIKILNELIYSQNRK